MEALSAASRRIDWDPAVAEDIEFDLARAGLNSDYALRNLAERELATPLRPLVGQVAGYAKHVQVVETLAALEAVRDQPEAQGRARAVVDPLLEVLRVAASDPQLDVVLITTTAAAGITHS